MRRKLMPLLLLLGLTLAHGADRLGWTDGAFPAHAPIEGGRKWICPVLGVATGAAILTGTAWTAIGFALWAGAEGCL